MLSPDLLNPTDQGGEIIADDHSFNNPNHDGDIGEKNGAPNCDFMQQQRTLGGVGHEADTPAGANPARYGASTQADAATDPLTPPAFPGDRSGGPPDDWS